ncbi:MAG: OsmC family protein [Vicinamibacterales bacterium]
MPGKPPAVVDLVWTGRLEFAANLSKTAIVVDSAGAAGPSPVELLATGLAGCMAVDLAHILTRGRHPFRSLAARLVAQRAPETPHRVTSVTLHFTLTGPVPHEAVARAIALSREKYCSVWHSMRQDIDLQATFDVSA